jgi:hypothetical protein
MNNPKRSKSEKRTVRVWTYDEAKKASPYIAGVMHSIREQRIEALSRDRQAKQLADRPGRPNRERLVAQAESSRLAREADDRFNDTLAELHAIDVFCSDPVRGEAFIPFLQDNKLAWFVFDLFDESDHLKQWRYHDDPLETRRPISETHIEPTNIAWTV